MAGIKQRRATRLIGAALAVGLGTAGVLMSSAAAEPTTVTCNGSSSFVLPHEATYFDSFLPILRADPPWTTSTHDLAAPIPAGTYQLDAVSYDGYPGRRLTTWQNKEIWYVEFQNASGVSLGVSGLTQDVPELADADEATWAGSIGSVTLSEPATRLVMRHGAQDEPQLIHSVKPVCVGWTPVMDESTTTTTTTTAPPTTAPPQATTVPGVGSSTSTTQPPVSQTTVPAQVLSTNAPTPISPAAQPVPARPTFTG